jgi:hypothetical protein
MVILVMTLSPGITLSLMRFVPALIFGFECIAAWFCTFKVEWEDAALMGQFSLWLVRFCNRDIWLRIQILNGPKACGRYQLHTGLFSVAPPFKTDFRYSSPFLLGEMNKSLNEHMLLSCYICWLLLSSIIATSKTLPAGQWWTFSSALIAGNVGTIWFLLPRSSWRPQGVSVLLPYTISEFLSKQASWGSVLWWLELFTYYLASPRSQELKYATIWLPDVWVSNRFKEKYERQIVEGTDKHASDRQKRIGFAVAEVKVSFCGVHPL